MMTDPQDCRDADRGAKLPITAIIPVLNCAHRMREHMEQSMEWLAEVSEIVVVDSHSKDDTVDIIMAAIGHLAPRVITHPVGLYTSWNRGVEAATNPYVYFSTVGDHISLAGLRKLLHTMTTLQTDVVISPPTFRHESTAACKSAQGTTWPIHEIVSKMGIREPILIDPWDLYDFVLIYLEQSVLGSSASNLYRREVLKQRPFSDDFHSIGDSAWIIEHNFDVRIAIHPQSFSTFLFHVKDWSFGKENRPNWPAMRQRLSILAYLKALDHCPWLEPEIASMARRALASRSGHVDSRSVESFFSATPISQPCAKTQATLRKLKAICLELDVFRMRALEHAYRDRISLLRYLWPPALMLRSRRKRAERRVRDIRQQL